MSWLRRSASNRQAGAASAQPAAPHQPLVDPDFIYDPRRHITEPAKIRRRTLRLKAATAILLAFVLVGGYVGMRLVALKKIFVANTNAAPVHLQQKLDVSTITSEGDGRINILMLGIGDVGHAGADLSDSMMVVSIDPRTHDVAMLSLPRDLYVNIAGHGFDKINAANALGDDHGASAGPQLAKDTVSQVLGIPIHYFIRTDFTGLKEAVNTLGGVTVAVASPLHDPEYPCSYNEKLSCGVTIPAGTQQMNGTVALEYARCRKGNCGSDFGRAKRQQQLLGAMRDKALTLTTLVNPAKIANLVDIVGGHVRTDISLDDMKKLYILLHDVDPNQIQNAVLDNSQNDLVTTGFADGQSVVLPTAGKGHYRQIQLFVRQLFFDGELKKEAASVAVVNASGNPTTGQNVCALLKSYNYDLTSCTDATSVAPHSTLTDYTNGSKTYTLQYLQKRFNLKAQKGEATATSSGAQIKLTIGADYRPSNDIAFTVN